MPRPACTDGLDKFQRCRATRRASGMKLLRIWVPDLHAPGFREEAERQVREAEAKLANLKQEIAALEATAKRETAEEAERIRALAQSDAKKVGVAAHAEIEAAERAARLELKAMAAALAVDGAESLLAKQLTPAAQESLVDTFVKSLEGRPN